MEAQVAALLAAAGAANGAAVEEAEEALALQVRCSCSWRKAHSGTPMLFLAKSPSCWLGVLNAVGTVCTTCPWDCWCLAMPVSGVFGYWTCLLS